MQDRRRLWHAAILFGWALALSASAQAQLEPAPVPPATATPAAEQRAMVIGVFPRYSIANTLAMFAPLADRLGRALGREVKLETARDFATFWQQVAQDRYDLVHYNQYHYIKARPLLGHRAIARNEEDGSATVVSAIVVRRDSNIDTLAALNGHTLLFGRGREAMQGYIAPSYLLRKAGLRSRDYAEQFARTPCDAVIAVYRRQAVAGAAPVACVNNHPEVDASALNIIAASEPLARSPWAVAKSVSPRLAQRVTEALTQLNGDRQGRAILAGMRLSGVVPASDADYALARRFVAEVLDERY